MRAGHERLTPYQRTQLWYQAACAIALGVASPPNQFERYVPIEAREEFNRYLQCGRLMPVTRRRLQVWAALAEVMEIDEFNAPLGFSDNDIDNHILLDA